MTEPGREMPNDTMTKWIDLSRACAVLALWSAGTLAHAQLEKLFIEGRMIDGQSGVVLHDAELSVIDSLDREFSFRARAGVRGEFSAALYSGAHYALRFTAPGYQDRCAVIDLKADRDWPDVSQVWTITMDVPMQPAAANGGAPAACDWRCTFKGRTSTLEWREDDARRMFPVVKAPNTRNAEELELSYHRADNRQLLVKGYVKDMRDDRPLDHVEVRFTAEGRTDTVITTDTKGYYELERDYDLPFRIAYSAADKVTKIVEVDPRTVPEKERKQGFVVWVDITLFAPIPDADLGFLSEPIGRAAYDPKSRTINWDMQYSLPLMERLNAILEKR